MKITPEQLKLLKTHQDIKMLLKMTKLKDIMTSPVITIRINESLSLVPKKLKDNIIRHLPVVDENNKLLGLITQRDLYRLQSPHKLMGEDVWVYDDDMLNSQILGRVMVSNPLTMNP